MQKKTAADIRHSAKSFSVSGGDSLVRKSIAARICGLYVVTPAVADDSELTKKCESALRGGAAVLQYRDKNASSQIQKRRACILRDLCAKHGALFIVNDSVALAMETGADGAHLGAKDGDIFRAREICGDTILLGATCGNDIGRAQKMLQEGADYCAFGAVFISQTKPESRVCGLPTISAAAKKIDSPVVAIGGITVQNAESVFRSGANAVAVCAGIFAASDIESAARKIAAHNPVPM